MLWATRLLPVGAVLELRWELGMCPPVSASVCSDDPSTAFLRLWKSGSPWSRVSENAIYYRYLHYPVSRGAWACSSSPLSAKGKEGRQLTFVFRTPGWKHGEPLYQSPAAQAGLCFVSIEAGCAFDPCWGGFLFLPHKKTSHRALEVGASTLPWPESRPSYPLPSACSLAGIAMCTSWHHSCPFPDD